MILVAGGTGRLGTSLVELLCARGEAVRILSRDADASVARGCELSIGDVRDPQTLRSAVDGASAVVSAVHGFAGGRAAGPAQIDDAGNVNLIDAATAVGVRRFVLISAFDARADNPMELHRAKHAAEAHLMRSGLNWTIIRPTAFLETWLGVIGNKTSSGGPALVFGSARNPINFVSVTDVATVVEQSLTDPAAHHAIIDVTGPENLTMLDMAHALKAAKVQRIPLPALRIMSHVARPFAPAFARQAASAVAMDTTDMTASVTAGRRTAQEVLRDRHDAADGGFSGT